jgi:hypothetical protein
MALAGRQRMRGRRTKSRRRPGGTRSDDGEVAVARLLTVTRTCQLRQLNALMYVTAAIRAHRRRQVVASLLSTSATR